jgi:hypothetical protein
VPEPPAKMIPFISTIIYNVVRVHINYAKVIRNGWKYKKEVKRSEWEIVPIAIGSE